ncbi:fanconi-associated nuclease 1 homolog isoform X2 [Diospyros lotus]|uniref:fanconi-associated nuclease 1 homolog isoform X2 n=1 Tax=Diospyros lotus TaxID=55363 RepID=UPI0022564668|nr:fanconi-associated nuclease 1 homolog isoform X2 [Diospyros lotus]
MLTGRESLIRLIGKRRRFLPNRQSVVSGHIQGCLSKDENGGDTSVRAGEHMGGTNDVVESTSAARPDLVTCPVCGNTLPGESSTINSHLDTCIARGTKRKLSQRTLLQLNFFAESKVKTHLYESDHGGGNVGQMAPDCNAICKLRGFVVDQEIDSGEDKSLFDLESASCDDGSVENPVNNDRINCSAVSPLLLPENEFSKYEMAKTMDEIPGMVLKTFIVGRKYVDGDKIELNPGATIAFTREPDNVKDCNAIKVLSADSGCKVLGFLPRQLARYLSPLMDKFCLSFEGCITSVPESFLDVVPIQIVCQSMASFGEKESVDLQVFKSLRANAMCIAESTKTCPLSMKKYQQNFSLLIQEVLRSNTHLFSYDEKIFLESFFSLSDDSQRLFIRLYTRKGPWFRVSNISYPEIFDCDKGVKELSASGYISSVGPGSELKDNDFKDILSMLTVSELHEILCTLKKKYNLGVRKKDLIASLLSSFADGLCALLPKLVLERTGTCIQISSLAESLVWRAERLFFLSGEQDLSAFLLVDLGIVKYPNYNCIMSDQILSSRNDLIAYEEAIEVAQIMDQSLDENNTELVLRCLDISILRMSNSSSKANHSSELPVTFFSCFSASWVYSKVALLGVSFLEREQRYSDAVILLKRLLAIFKFDRRRGYWTLRLSIDLEHTGYLSESLLVAENGLLDPWVRAGSRIALQRRVLRLGKPPRRWKTPSFSDSVKRKISEVFMFKGDH